MPNRCNIYKFIVNVNSQPPEGFYSVEINNIVGFKDIQTVKCVYKKSMFLFLAALI